ncbi:hypothetical protein N8603_01085 [Verrucomicrobiales bacterium]|nr:hypothetical protein [Verrucomicrobiales bacterium]
MKKILTLITSALVISGSSAFAWVGGPWSNNSYSQTTTGTYQAVMYMVNGVGLARFSDDITTQFSQVNQSVIFHEGTVYIGQCFGTADRTSGSGSGSVTGIINSASAAGGTVTGTFQCDITSDAPVMRFYGTSSGITNPITGEPGNGSDQKCILVLSEPAADPVEPAETRVVATTVFGAQISYTIIAVAAAE